MVRVSKSVLIALFMLASTAAVAQWYQGPSGGTGGSPFDSWQDSGHASDIDQLSVVVTDSIRCIKIHYRDGTPFVGLYGSCGSGGAEDWHTWKTQAFGLERDEYLLGIAGTNGDHINSIKFYTNKRTWSPTRGSTSGVPFGYTAPSGQMIVGLTGRAGESLDSIGVMYAPCPPTTKACR